MNRREFVAWSGLSALALQLACGGKKQAGAASGDVWAVLRQAREAIRASPDHLAARADDAVATKDAKTIAKFVREHIIALPPASDRISPVTQSLWGTRATLRAGAGSLRDRADVLAELLRRAGFTATVVTVAKGTVPATALFATHPQDFAPDLTKLAGLGVKGPLDGKPDAATGGEVDALAAKLLAAIPEAARRSQARAVLDPDQVPIVEYSGGGRTGWAIAYGDVDVVDAKPMGYGAAAADAVKPTVKVTVSVALSPPRGSTVDRTVVHDVVSAEWPAEHVAGGMVLLGFAAPGVTAKTLFDDHSSSPLRVPVLRLTGATIADAPANVVLGRAIELAGGVAPAKESGEKWGFIEAPDRAKRATTVAKLDAMIHAGAFPTIDVDLAVRDAAGVPIDGLGASDLHLREDGKDVPVALLRNTVPAGVRILVMYDASGSVTEAWGSVAKRTAFETAFATALADAHAKAPFVVQIVGLGGNASPTAWAAPDATALAQQLARTSSTSDVWGTLGQTLPASGAAAAILISDAVSSLESAVEIPGWQRALGAAGIPLAVVPIGKADRVATAKIEALAGGIELAPGDPALATKLGEFARDRVAHAASTSYRLRYTAPDAGAATRTVEIAVGSVKTSATYQVPAERGLPSGISGLYVTIAIGDRTVRRRLAGVDVSYRGALAPVSADALAEVRRALDGVHEIAFETATPTIAAMLDDAIAAMLALEPVHAAGKDVDKLVAAAQRMIWFDGGIARIHDPVATRGGTTPSGLHAIITSFVAGERGITRRVDIIPELAVWVGTSADPAEAFAAALRTSLALGVREGQQPGTTAIGVLAGKQLAALAPRTALDAITAWTPAQRAALRPLVERTDEMLRLIASDGTPALWGIDPLTGSATPIDLAGRGGATDETCTIDNLAQQSVTIALILISALCTAGNPTAYSNGWYACVGADVNGAAASARASFTAPAGYVGFSTFVSPILYGLGLGAGGLGLASRALVAVLIAIMSVMAASCKRETS